MLYARFQIANQGRAPASEDQFRAFIEAEGEKVLEIASVDSVDQLFYSPRDGEPYVVLYGSAAAIQNPSGFVAYERKGVDGLRYVGNRLGYVEAVNDERFRQLAPDAAADAK